MDEYNSEDDEMKVPEVKSISEPQTGSVKVIKEENQSDARLRSDHFTVEIVSCQGMIFESLSSSDSIYEFQMHLSYQGASRHSPRVRAGPEINKPILFHFTTTFDPLPPMSTITNGRPEAADGPLLVLVTATPVRVPRIGFDETQQLLVAQATIDEGISKLYSGDFISAELTPCLVDYLYAAGEAPGSVFLRVRHPHGLTGAAPELEAQRSLIEASMRAKQTLMTTLGRDTLQSLKAWWTKLRREHPALARRPLRFLAEDECGRHRFVGSFVRPSPPGRALDGPRFAARFVSLIPFARDASLAGGRVSRWQGPLATLARLAGDVEDHATLLCSLLLGWGLNAFVALGTLHSTSEGGEGSHCWVATLCETGLVTYWESLTGEATDARDKAGPYREIWALFRMNEYWVNVQRDSGAASTALDLRDPRLWRRFSVPAEAVATLSHPAARLSLHHDLGPSPAPLPVAVEEELEQGLARWWRELRAREGLQTFFDDRLSVVLQPALASYELSRAAGPSASFGNSDFQAAVRGLVGRGECFKAYPACFNHTDLESMAATLARTRAAREILLAKRSEGAGEGPSRLALRVRVFAYPRGLCSVWIALAVCQPGE